MAKKLRRFLKMKEVMQDMTGQSNAELAVDMGITDRRVYQCVQTNKIPYGAIIQWCLMNNVALEDILIEKEGE